MKKIYLPALFLSLLFSGCQPVVPAFEPLPPSTPVSHKAVYPRTQETVVPLMAKKEQAVEWEIPRINSEEAVEWEIPLAAKPTPLFAPPKDATNEKLTALLYSDFAKGPPPQKFIYPVTSDWSSTISNYSYDTPLQAHLSWKVSWILEGLYYAYKATEDVAFLEESILLYDALLAQRDDATGRVAFDGHTYPLWGSTARYNGSFYTLKDADGNTLARLQFHSQHNDQTQIAVTANPASDTFSMQIRHKDTAFSLSGLTLSTLAQRLAAEVPWSFYGSAQAGKAVMEVLFVDKDASALPASHPFVLVENTNVPTPIHSALLLEPMVLTYLELKQQGYPQAKRFQKEISLMFDTLLQNNWDSRGFFKEMDNSPTFLGGGEIIPWNQQLPLVCAMALFAHEEADEHLREVVNQACTYFKSKLTATPTGYLWRYWEDPSGTVTYWETTNYAALDLNSIRLIHSVGMGFHDADLALFSQTVQKGIFKNPQTPATRIDGSAPTSANLTLLPKYLPFAEAVPALLPLAEQQALSWDSAAKLLYFRNQ